MHLEMSADGDTERKRCGVFSRSLALCSLGELGKPPQSGADADGNESIGRGAQGKSESNADARDPMTSPTERPAVPNRFWR
jgi:hypothetical protein